MGKFIDRGIPLILAGILFLSHAGFAQETQLPSREMAQYYIGMIYKGDVWGSFSREEAAKVQRGHIANIRRLEQAGKLVLVEAGRLRIELFPMWAPKALAKLPEM